MTTHSHETTDRNQWLVRLALGGGVALAAGVFVAPERVWSNLLLITFYLLTIALGGAVFVALTCVSGASWSVAFRRVPEAMARMLPIAGIAMLAVLLAGISRYGWHAPAEHGAGTFWFKQLWLTPSFWMARAVAYIVVWSLLARWIVARSIKQDQSGDPRLASGDARLSAIFLAVYAVTFSLASADWIMALEPMWFSTMWGVYQFAGMLQSAVAVVILLGLLLRSGHGPLDGVFTDEHLHDLGRLLLGFSCFWMYIWFSQYMLIWYSNIPEETSYFITRTHGPWGPVVVASIVLNWIVPFFVLLPKPAKRNASVMMKVAVVVLIGRWVDLFVMIFPATLGAMNDEGLWEAASPTFGVWETASVACLIAAAGLLLVRIFSSHKAVPEKDPRLPESLSYHAS